MENLSLTILENAKGGSISSSCPLDCSPSSILRVRSNFPSELLVHIGAQYALKNVFTLRTSCTVQWSSRLTPASQPKYLGCAPNPLPASLGKHEEAN